MLLFMERSKVFFRYNTKLLAQKLNLVGWVRNNPDGTVEAVFEGEESALNEMLKFCRIGPKAARVEKVKIKWEKATNEFKIFEIRY